MCRFFIPHPNVKALHCHISFVGIRSSLRCPPNKGNIFCLNFASISLFFLIDSDHNASLELLLTMHLYIAMAIFWGCTPRTLAMYLIEDIGPALIIVSKITCFDGNLAP